MDECASHVTLFSIQALSLELAGKRRFATLAALAIIIALISLNACGFYMIKSWLIFICLIICVCPVARKCFVHMEAFDTQTWSAVSLLCLFVCLFVWVFSTHSRIFHPYRDVTISDFFFHKVYDNISKFTVISVIQFWSIHDTYGNQTVRV